MKKLTEQEKQAREKHFLNTLEGLQNKHKAYWIKALHVRKALFGMENLARGPKLYERYLKFTRNVARTRRLYEKLEKQGRLRTKRYKINEQGIAYVYLHAERVPESKGFDFKASKRFDFKAWFKSLGATG